MPMTATPPTLMVSKAAPHKPCKTCCISEVCIQSVVRGASCPVNKVQLSSLYGKMNNTEPSADKHTEPNKSFN